MRPIKVWISSTTLRGIAAAVAVVAVAGCASVSPGIRGSAVSNTDSPASALAVEQAEAPIVAAQASEGARETWVPTVEGNASPELDLGVETSPAAPRAMHALAAPRNSDDEDLDEEPYDPWESFNEKTFDFNIKVDRHVLKPAAKAYDRVVPDELQRMIANGFDNINSLPRLVNSLLQAKWTGALREAGRFMINSTVGIGGLWDMAKQEWGIEKSSEDFGQTLGVWGVGSGPYLVLPLLEPMTVRDGIGRFVDGFIDPLSYVLPLFPHRAGMKLGDIVNERSLNLELFQGFEETVIDLYSAVRHAYLERRRQLIKQ